LGFTQRQVEKDKPVERKRHRQSSPSSLLPPTSASNPMHGTLWHTCVSLTTSVAQAPSPGLSENSHSFLVSAQNQFNYITGHQFMTKAETWQHWRPDLRDLRWRDSDQRPCDTRL